MKKLQLFSLLWLFGLFAFSFMPAFAQDAEEISGGEEIVATTENVDAVEDVAVAAVEDVAVAEDEINYGVDEDGNTLESAVEEVATESIDLGDFDLNVVLENDEIRAAIDEAWLTNEEAAWILGGMMGLLAGFGVAGCIIAMIWCILGIVAMWRIFTKAGEAGWKSIIPIYNLYIMYKIVGMKSWFWYFLLVPFCLWFIAWIFWEQSNAGVILQVIAFAFSWIVNIVAMYKLPRKFGRNVFTSVLFVLFPAICILILGFGNYKYQWKEETVVEA